MFSYGSMYTIVLYTLHVFIIKNTDSPKIILLHAVDVGGSTDTGRHRA